MVRSMSAFIQSFLFEILQSPLALIHYNPKLEIIVSADASNYGIGARIAHKIPDGSVIPIALAPGSLTPAEFDHSQIEKERLALILAVNTVSSDNFCTTFRFGNALQAFTSYF